MRNWMNLFEAAPTKTATKLDLDLSDTLSNKGDLATATAPGDVAVPGKAAGASRTRAAMSTGALPVEAGGHFANLAASGLEDEIDDAEAARRAGVATDGDDDDTYDDYPGDEPVTPANLPSVIRDDLMITDDPEVDPTFDPEWHMVRHLPGYMQSGIRAIGRAVFSPFTDTPIEDIQVLSTLSNPTEDVQKMMAWVVRNGQRDDAADLNFERVMPGYQARIRLYRTRDADFMMVEDMGGKYIYAWPGGRGVDLESPADMKQLPAR